MLLPTPPRLIVARVLNNLRATLEQRDDEARLPILARCAARCPSSATSSAPRRRWLAGWN